MALLVKTYNRNSEDPESNLGWISMSFLTTWIWSLVCYTT